MQVNVNYRSPNFQTTEIPVEFLVLHYTGCDLQKTLEIFMDEKSKVAAHFVIDETGVVYDLGIFLKGSIYKGAHAGKSRLDIEGNVYESFNDFSVGIEIVNLNGNFFEYKEAQYLALKELILELQARFPKLKKSERIIGHEHIAFWRGKSDPGLKFDWERLLRDLNMKMNTNHHFHVCLQEDVEFIKNEMSRSDKNQNFWPALSQRLESKIADRESKKSSSP
jgi:N-acetyl-anhydromuramyl-L-alanine amidase AmpD